MPAFKHEASIYLTDGANIEIRHLLEIFAGTIALAQKKLDKRQLSLAQKLLDSTQPGIFKQLLNVLCFSRYRIEEMTVEFFVIAEESDSEPNAPFRFQFAQEHIEHERIRQASIRVYEADQKMAEFRVEDKLISILTFN